ncbi:MAG: DUF4143 domain-containing protein [Propionibacteriaceae bacterium]|jgi:predicted AAA+ superfamily ATPase|nr:DUF4143 domain-containing protein [Propionibacteriaceae bacterium]
MVYLPRILDSRLERLLADLPAVAVDGPRAVGKSSTATRLAASVIDLDLPDQLELTVSNPGRLARLPKPLLIDEWQSLPSVWDRVRRLVDDGAEAGSFLLTGSASPVVRPMHTGAGRIVRVRLRPMSLAERGLVAPTVSVGDLLTGQRADVTGECPLGVEDYAREITAGGFPGLRAAPERSRSDALDGYLADVVERDFPDSGRTVRRPGALRAWLRSYAAATATTAAYNQILDAATPGENDKPAKATTLAYRNVLERMWLLDELPAWSGRNHLAALSRVPKHHLADPALASRLLGVDATALLERPNPDRPSRPRIGTLFGALFEGLATLCVRVYAEANRARVSYLRTAKGNHEVDLIVEGEDGRILPIEVKSAAEVSNADVAHLLWLRHNLGQDVADLVVLTTGEAAYRRLDGVAVVPLALLGP